MRLWVQKKNSKFQEYIQSQANKHLLENGAP